MSNNFEHSSSLTKNHIFINMLKVIDNDIIKMFNNGKTCQEISSFFDCNVETIRLRLKKAGINTNKKKTYIE